MKDSQESPLVKCRKVKEEFILVFSENEDGRQLRVAIQRHVTVCPECAAKAEHTRRIVTLIRERCRCEAPRDLRHRILSKLQGGREQKQAG